MSKRVSFAAGAVMAGVAVAALLLGLTGAQADGVVAIHATDSGYQGVPRQLNAGEIRFSFTNDSKTAAHEMSLFRINDGVKDSFEQILAEDEAQEQQAEAAQQGGQQGSQNPPAEQAPPPPPKMTFFGGNGAGPGTTARMDIVGNLPAGRYGIASFVPADDGSPDYKKGLKAEFTVK